MRIGIMGAGIAGLVSAAALQSDGHDVALFERRDEAGAIGAGLTLFPNAFAALDAVGLGDAVRSVSSTALGKLRSGQRQPSGRWLLTMPPEHAPTIHSVVRADLHTVLIEQLAPETLHTSSPASASADGSPIIEVAGDTHEFDLVIAADGIRSTARARWGLDRGLRYAGYTARRGVTASHPYLGDAAGETWGRGARFGIVPLPEGRIYWFATLTTPPGGRDANAQDELLDLFGTWHAPIATLIRQTPPEAIIRHDIYDLDDLPATFVHGRGVLLGDAAHAMTPDLGQGAGQGIEDAATLTLLLRGATPAGLTDRLAQFDALRRTRTRALWQQSRRVGRIAQARNPLAAALRDSGMRITPPSLMARAGNRLHRWEPSTAQLTDQIALQWEA